MGKLAITFDKPALEWEESLPIGNGSQGAMITGGLNKEKLGLNLDTLWSGTLRDMNNYSAREYLNKTREEIFAGHYTKASKMVEEDLLGEFGEGYLPLGNLYVRVENSDHNDTNEVTDYVRELSLNDSLATVSYSIGEQYYKREYFASYPDHLIAAGFSSSKKATYCLSFDSELKYEICSLEDSFKAENITSQIEKLQRNGMAIYGRCPEHGDPSYLDSSNPIIWGENGLRFLTEIEIINTDGECIFDNEKSEFIIKDAKELQFVIRSASGTREDPKEITLPAIYNILLEKVGEHKTFPGLLSNYETLKKEHLRDYHELFDRVTFDLDGQENEIYPLFFQYGRYLLISSSREGSEAANLQGIWNWQMRAPWSANYTTNINVEMNYWPAQVCGLKECIEPYYRLLSELVENGRRTAKVHFGCRGFCVGHNTDYWRFTNPVGVPYGEDKGVDGSSLYAFFILSAQWMCQELWKGYEYQKDREFLRSTVFPIIKEAALFAVDWLVEFEGQYFTCPSASPENQFVTEDGLAPISYATTMDMTIVREIFEEYEQALLELNKLENSNEKIQKAKYDYQIQDKTGLSNEELLQLIQERREKLAPYKIGQDGRLLEWVQDFEESEPGHRHISHVYGLFPGKEFRLNEELKEACRKTIDYRLSHGGGHTGWSCAWIINLYAVLGDGEKAYEYLKTLMDKCLCPNLWTIHPPFQIDSNFGGTMAIANMLVQEEGDEVKILPAIPKSWPKGSVTGLRLTNNRAIDISWDRDKVTHRIYKVD